MCHWPKMVGFTRSKIGEHWTLVNMPTLQPHPLYCTLSKCYTLSTEPLIPPRHNHGMVSKNNLVFKNETTDKYALKRSNPAPLQSKKVILKIGSYPVSLHGGACHTTSKKPFPNVKIQLKKFLSRSKMTLFLFERQENV